VHLFDQRILGVFILLLLAGLVVVKRAATGSVLDKPQGGPLLQLVNVFNLFFLLVVNPLAAVALLSRRLEAIDPTRVAIAGPRLLPALEIAGLALYAGGFLLMAWALVVLGRSYQLGGCDPRMGDRLVVGGPYRFTRNPMYTAALAIALGLACLLQSLAFFAVFAVYLPLILLLVPMEEDGLLKKYGEAYAAYRRRSKKLVPFLY
jgi:protein-S-isoprenylcysteine O-methyltransferase Ste14